MSYRESFAYWLTVEGSEEDLQKVYDLLKEKDLNFYLSPHDETRPPKQYGVPEHIGAVEEWEEDIQEKELHDIALAVPNARLSLRGECVESMKSSYEYEKVFHGDLYQEVYVQTYMPKIREDGFIPFDKRREPVQKPSLDQILEEYHEKQKALTETYRGFIKHLDKNNVR